jgi:hypothetical protein
VAREEPATGQWRGRHGLGRAATAQGLGREDARERMGMGKEDVSSHVYPSSTGQDSWRQAKGHVGRAR